MAMSEKDRKMLGFLGVAIVCYLIYNFAMPMHEEHLKRLTEIETRVQELRDAHDKASNLNKLYQEVRLVRQTLDAVKRRIPGDLDKNDFLDKVQAHARTETIEIKSIAFQPSPLSGPGYKAETIIVDLNGPWLNIIGFLWRLQNFERLLDITSIRLGAQESAKLGGYIYSVQVAANIFISSDI